MSRKKVAALSIAQVIPQILSVRDEPKGCGPRMALTRLDLKAMSSEERSSWLKGARADAILGSCARSLKFVQSGLRCYEGFMSQARPNAKYVLPPLLDDLLAWSIMFRSDGTLSNYLGHVKTACMLYNVAVKVFDNVALKRAKEAVRKRHNFEQRPKLWIQRGRVQEIIELCDACESYASYAHLFLLSYAFLLRVPSEAIPVTAGKGSGPCALYREGETLILELKRRYHDTRICWYALFAFECL